MNKTITLFATAAVIAASALTFAGSASANGWGGGYGVTPGAGKMGGGYGGKPGMGGSGNWGGKPGMGGGSSWGGKPGMGGGSNWGGKPGGTFVCVRAPCNAPSGGKWGGYPSKVGGKWQHGTYGGSGGYYPSYPRPTVIVRPAPVIYPAPVAYPAPVITKTVVAAPVAAVAAPVPAPANSCTCLTKEYGQDGSVIFKDICTNEAAAVALQPPAAQ